MSTNDETIRALEDLMSPDFWDNVIQYPPGWQPPPIRAEDIRVEDICPGNP